MPYAGSHIRSLKEARIIRWIAARKAIEEEAGMEIVDAQVHVWEPSNALYPWDPTYGNPPHVRNPLSTAAVRAAMDSAGVDAGIVVTPTVYGYDNRYSLEAVRQYPTEFAVIGRIDSTVPDLDDRVRTWREQPGMLGLRVTVSTQRLRDKWYAGGFDAVFAASERYDVPVCVYPPHMLAALALIPSKHQGVQIVVDHLGLSAPPVVPADPDLFQDLPQLLALAHFRNVAVKMTGVPSLSKESFPFRDTWPHLLSVIDAFGPDRVMWGSDFTRVRGLGRSYIDGVRYVDEIRGLSTSDKEMLFGKTVRQILRWPKGEGA